ncbi:MAG: hypothetical protein HWN51_00330 [Desulfobacterales bacterium]|nr:hypothetical protein [Desulfobacterales bacterium]
MPAVLFKIPLVPWVRKTVEKMSAIDQDDSQTWNRFWLQAYVELGGISENSGSKVCPKSAAYGLWRLGRIAGSGKPFQNWPIGRVKEELGKNVAYAVLALDLLEVGWGPEDIESLWIEVRRLYRQKLADTPARTQQGAVKVASILFSEGQIVSKPR